MKTKDPNSAAEYSLWTLDRRTMLKTTAAGMFALALPGGARAASSGPIKIGFLGPFTGPASRTGEELKNGAIMALEDARKAGEVPIQMDGGDRDIEYVWIDTESSPESAVKALTHAMDNDDIEILWGGWHSSVAMALMEVAADNHIVGLAIGGNSSTINDKINSDPQRYRGWFKNWPASQMEANLYGAPLEHFIESGRWTPRNKKAAILVEDTDFGRGWGKAMVSNLNAAGFEPLPFDTFSIDEVDFAPLITKYRAQDVAVVGITGTAANSIANFLKQARGVKLDSLILAHGISWSSDWYELSGAASDYVLAADTAVALTPESKDWLERYEAEFGEEPSIAASGHQYDLCRLGVRILEEAGSMDFDRIVTVIRNVEYQGLFQNWRWSTEITPNAMSPNDVIVGDYQEGFFFPMAQLMEGDRKVVYPVEYAEAELQLPPRA